MPSFSLLDICGGEKDVEYGVYSTALQKEDVARRGRGARTGSAETTCGAAASCLGMGVATTDGGGCVKGGAVEEVCNCQTPFRRATHIKIGETEVWFQ
jgi:hypothetical protein